MKTILAFQLIATVLSLGLFLKGFFPLKKTWDAKQKKDYPKNYPSSLNQEADPTGAHSSVEMDEVLPSDFFPQNFPRFRIVLMVIDAFREDFAYGPLRLLRLTHDILNNGKGLKFTAETMPPTVTLPRIKAMVTGSTSSFADVVLNFGSSELEEDNIVSRLKAEQRKVIFYGDDTWLKLFPTHFERSDGTTSFFVSDYTEVDDNVTRHLKTELERPTWDVMILHYLGLDHIGHFAGPRSPLIAPKLAEMDTIINQIFTAMEKWSEPSMLIVCGDHGMSDQGGHGGASPGEITVPVLFLSPQIFNSDPKHLGTISQTDLCPTLAVLQGVPIPSGNIGKVVTEALIGFTLLHKVTLLLRNAQQAMDILKDCVTDLQKESAHFLFQQAEGKLEKWIISKNSSSKTLWEAQGQSLISSFNEVLTLISGKVSTLATRYDVYAMAISIVLMWMILISLVLSSVQEKQQEVKSVAATLQLYGAAVLPVVGSAVLSHIIMCTGGVPSETVCSASPSGVMLQTVLMLVFACLALHMVSSWPSLNTLREQTKTLISQCGPVEGLLLVGTAAHSLTLMSSSLVEEEHQTFYFLVTAVHLLILGRLCVRFLRGFGARRGAQNLVWNSTSVGGGLRDQETERDLYTKPFSSDCVVSSSCSAPCTQSLPREKQDGQVKTEDEEISCVQRALPRGYGVGAESNQPAMTWTSFVHWTFSVAAVLLMLRVLRRWNHTGNKWLDCPDLGDWLVKPENQSSLSLLTVFAFMIIGASRGGRLRRVQTMCVNVALTYAYLCRAAEGSLIFPYRKLLSSSGVTEARVSYFFIVLTYVISGLPENFLKLESKKDLQQPQQPSSSSKDPKLKPISSTSASIKKKHLCSSSPNLKHSDLTLKSLDSEPKPRFDHGFPLQQRLRGVLAATVCFACLVKQPHNAAVCAIMSLAEQMMTPVLTQIGLGPVHALLYSVWMAQVFFFLQGNSNSLSTVDIAAGYVGLDSYWPAMNGLLLVLSTYVGSVFWSLAFLNFLLTSQEQQGHTSRPPSVPEASCRALLLTRVIPLSVYMALVAAQRYHLFVWSVFSPKMLYEAVSTVVVGLQLVLFGCCSKFWAFYI